MRLLFITVGISKSHFVHCFVSSNPNLLNIDRNHWMTLQTMGFIFMMLNLYLLRDQLEITLSLNSSS